jgi:hypothetical protein
MVSFFCFLSFVSFFYVCVRGVHVGGPACLQYVGLLQHPTFNAVAGLFKLAVAVSVPLSTPPRDPYNRLPRMYIA